MVKDRSRLQLFVRNVVRRVVCVLASGFCICSEKIHLQNHSILEEKVLKTLNEVSYAAAFILE